MWPQLLITPIGLRTVQVFDLSDLLQSSASAGFNSAAKTKLTRSAPYLTEDMTHYSIRNFWIRTRDMPPSVALPRSAYRSLRLSLLLQYGYRWKTCRIHSLVGIDPSVHIRYPRDSQTSNIPQLLKWCGIQIRNLSATLNPKPASSC